MARAEGGGGAARSPRHDEPRGQERLPRDPPAVARLRGRRDAEGGIPTCAGRGRRVRCRSELHGHGVRHPLPDEGQEQGLRAQHDRPARHQQEHPDGLSRRRRLQARPRNAARGAQGTAEEAARPDCGRQQAHPRTERPVARRVDAASHQRLEASITVPRHTRPDERRGHTQHGHHSRCGQPAR